MRIDKNVFGRITINGVKESLGVASMTDILLRASHKWTKAKAKSTRNVGIIELSDEELPEDMVMDQESQLLHEFNSLSQKVDGDAESDMPGLTWTRVGEILDCPRYSAYRKLAASPANRIGLSPEEVQAIRNNGTDDETHDWGLITPWVDS